jgi:hypothetical protein
MAQVIELGIQMVALIAAIESIYPVVDQDAASRLANCNRANAVLRSLFTIRVETASSKSIKFRVPRCP